MSKSVMISIKPRYCELIASGKKTVEVRKTFPKLKTPFKCYIYCTRGVPFLNRHNGKLYLEAKDRLGGHGNGLYERLSGKVIGEFICDGIRWMGGSFWAVKDDIEEALQGSCVSYEELKAYLRVVPGSSVYNKKREFYRWHISDLKIYDEPKELRNFIRPSGGCCNEGKCTGCRYFQKGNGYNLEDDCYADFDTDEYSIVKRPPQSWCYVEEIE